MLSWGDRRGSEGVWHSEGVGVALHLSVSASSSTGLGSLSVLGSCLVSAVAAMSVMFTTASIAFMASSLDRTLLCVLRAGLEDLSLASPDFFLVTLFSGLISSLQAGE